MSYLERELLILKCKIMDVEHYMKGITDHDIAELHTDNFKSIYMMAVDIMNIANKIQELKNGK
jgi:hypothetical protein